MASSLCVQLAILLVAAFAAGEEPMRYDGYRLLNRIPQNDLQVEQLAALRNDPKVSLVWIFSKQHDGRNFPEWALDCPDSEFTLTTLHTAPSPCGLFTFYNSRVRVAFRVPINQGLPAAFRCAYCGRIISNTHQRLFFTITVYIRKIDIVAMHSGDVNKHLDISPSIRKQSQKSTLNITCDTSAHVKQPFFLNTKYRKLTDEKD